MERLPDATLEDVFKMQESIVERLERMEKKLFEIDQTVNPKTPEGPKDSRMYSFP